MHDLNLLVEHRSGILQLPGTAEDRAVARAVLKDSKEKKLENKMTSQNEKAEELNVIDGQ